MLRKPNGPCRWSARRPPPARHRKPQSLELLRRRIAPLYLGLQELDHPEFDLRIVLEVEEQRFPFAFLAAAGNGQDWAALSEAEGFGQIESCLPHEIRQEPPSAVNRESGGVNRTLPTGGPHRRFG